MQETIGFQGFLRKNEIKFTRHKSVNLLGRPIIKYQYKLFYLLTCVIFRPVSLLLKAFLSKGLGRFSCLNTDQNLTPFNGKVILS